MSTVHEDPHSFVDELRGLGEVPHEDAAPALRPAGTSPVTAWAWQSGLVRPMKEVSRRPIGAPWSGAWARFQSAGSSAGPCSSRLWTWAGGWPRCIAVRAWSADSADKNDPFQQTLLK